MYQDTLLKYGLNDSVLQQIIEILFQAGRIAIKYHASSELKIYYKDDKTPVTNADIEVNDLIINALNNLVPKINIISEENSTNHLVDNNIFWLLDPIDGTAYYIKGLTNYTINLALIINCVPVLGFKYHPALGELHYTDLTGRVILYNRQQYQNFFAQSVENIPNIKVLINNKQDNLNRIEQESLFSKIYPSEDRNKISMVLNNQVDVYYLYNHIMEWDTAAGHAILIALGGQIFDMQGVPLKYGKPFFTNPQIIICGYKAMFYKEMILNNN